MRNDIAERSWCETAQSAAAQHPQDVSPHPEHYASKRVQTVAASEGLSMNELMTRVLSLATDSDERDPAAVRLPERLRAAGMLASWTSPPGPPDAADLERARTAAGAATPLADIVSAQRR